MIRKDKLNQFLPLKCLGFSNYKSIYLLGKEANFHPFRLTSSGHLASGRNFRFATYFTAALKRQVLNQITWAVQNNDAHALKSIQYKLL